MKKFIEILGKDNPLLKSIKEIGYEEPTEIQEKSIPKILRGQDIIASASTGSGKTLCFAAGLIKNSKKDSGIQGLVLTPTRELAEQITKELLKFSKYKKLNIQAIYGGVSITHQIKYLPEAEIVVGTPGRILDHLERKTIDLSWVKTLVLDEADRMLDMGFKDDVEKIIKKCPKKRHNLLFSATISQEIVHLSKKFLNNFVEVSAESYVDPKKLKQVYYDVQDNLKFSLLKHLLENEKSQLAMVFCNTRTNVDFVANNLKHSRVKAMAIHGGFTQDKRKKIMERFYSKEVNVLVCTDVAARGLDIKGVSHVYNYNIPSNSEEYIHRIGRTARAGKSGKVINLISSRDYENFNKIMREDFNILCIKTPFIKKVKLNWMPKKSNRKFSHRRYR